VCHFLCKVLEVFGVSDYERGTRYLGCGRDLGWWIIYKESEVWRVSFLCKVQEIFRVSDYTRSITCLGCTRYLGYGVATMSRLLKNIDLFCKRAL